MAIVACADRRVVALALAATLAACGPAPSSAPSAAQPTAAEPGEATHAAACHGIGLPAEVPATPSIEWSRRVFYEVFVRSFKDSNGDGIGDLAGLTAKLDYLNDGDPSTTSDLGVTGIWLMPIAASPSYHGYDVTDYMAVEPDYGDRAALTSFLDAAHARGIDVIVDFVINHTSSQHPWFKDALQGGPHHDWYVWSDTDPHWPPVAGGNPWHLASNGEYYYGAFWEGMPDLNLGNPEVTVEIDRIADFWLDDLGVDGFRIDAAKHLIEVDAEHQVNTPETLAWLADFSRHVHAKHPAALLVDEVYDIATLAGRYVPDSADLTFDFGLASASTSALQAGRVAAITTALGETLTSWPPNRHASFLTNHDQDRIMSQLNGDLPSARLAALMYLTLPGVPFVYYGEEVGLQGRKPDERIRTPMPWSAEEPAGGFSTGQPWEPLAEGWQTANVAAEASDAASLLSTYRDLIALRGAHSALTEGATWLVDGGAEPVIGWLRAAADEALLTVVNVSGEGVRDYGLSLDEGPLCGFRSADLKFLLYPGDNIVAGEPLAITSSGGLSSYKPLGALAPRSGYVLELTRS